MRTLPPGAIEPPTIRQAPSPTQHWQRVILAPNWTLEVDEVASGGVPTLVVTAEHIDDPPEGVEVRYLSVECRMQDATWLGGISTDDAVIAVSAGRAREFARYELAFWRIRGPKRRLNGPYSPLSSLTGIISARFARCVWSLTSQLVRWALITIWPLLFLLACRRPGRSASLIGLHTSAVRRLLAWRPPISGNPRVTKWWCLLLLGFARAAVVNRRVGQIAPTQRILIVMPDLIGDTISTLPLARKLKADHPKARIDLLAATKTASVISLCPYIDDIITYDEPHPNHHHHDVSLAQRKSSTKSLESLRARNYDLAICPSYWPERSEILNAVDARKILLPQLREWLVWGADHTPPPSDQWIFSRSLHICGYPPEDPSGALLVPTDEMRHEAMLLRRSIGDRLLVGVITQAPLAPRRIAAGTLRSAILNVSSTTPIAVAVFDRQDSGWRRFASTHQGMIVDWPGDRPLQSAVTTLLACDLLVGAEGGLGHIAGALGIPNAPIFTSTAPQHWRPWSHTHPIMGSRVACFPCYRNYCPWALQCHQAIDAQRLADAILQVLRRRTSLGS